MSLVIEAAEKAQRTKETVFFNNNGFVAGILYRWEWAIQPFETFHPYSSFNEKVKRIILEDIAQLYTKPL